MVLVVIKKKKKKMFSHIFRLLKYSIHMILIHSWPYINAIVYDKKRFNVYYKSFTLNWFKEVNWPNRQTDRQTDKCTRRCGLKSDRSPTQPTKRLRSAVQSYCSLTLIQNPQGSVSKKICNNNSYLVFVIPAAQTDRHTDAGEGVVLNNHRNPIQSTKVA